MQRLAMLCALFAGCVEASRSARPGLMLPDAGAESEAESEAEAEAEAESESEAEAESESESESEPQCTLTSDCAWLNDDCYVFTCIEENCLPSERDADGDGFSIGGWCPGTDCNDTNSQINLATEELCDGLDNDCNGAADEIFRTGGCYVGDGGCRVYGVMACQPDGTNVCSDLGGNPIAPGLPSPEVCLDGTDNDCNGTVDADCPCPNGTETRWRDEDGDGFGDPRYEGIVCADAPPVEGVRVAGDCNDFDASVHPYADELCDGIDNDCDPATADGATFIGNACYTTDEGCGFEVCHGECQFGDFACVEGAPYCDNEVLPTSEVCGDGLDHDCDGEAGCDDDDCSDECAEACTLVTIEDGTVVPANGAPNFSIVAGSPAGVTVAALISTLHFNIYALGECDDIVIDDLNFQITFTDNAGSGWRPYNIFLVELSEPRVGIPANVIEERDGATVVTVPTNLFVRAGTSLTVELQVDASGVSTSLDDRLEVTVKNPVRWHVNEEGAAILTTQEETLPLNGYVLSF